MSAERALAKYIMVQLLNVVHYAAAKKNEVVHLAHSAAELSPEYVK